MISKKLFEDGYIVHVILAGVVVAACGYAANLYKIWAAVDGGVTAKLLLRLVGVFAFPIGVILGFF